MISTIQLKKMKQNFIKFWVEFIHFYHLDFKISNSRNCGEIVIFIIRLKQFVEGKRVKEFMVSDGKREKNWDHGKPGAKV